MIELQLEVVSPLLYEARNLKLCAPGYYNPYTKEDIYNHFIKH